MRRAGADREGKPRVVVAIMVDTDGERIRRVFGVANPDKLRALAD